MVREKSHPAKTGGRFFPPGFGFVLPGFLGLLLFFVLPFCLSLGYAFMDRPVNGSFAAFANFAALFRSRAWRIGMINTLRFTGAASLLSMGLSLVLALLLNTITKYREWFTLVFLVPLVIPSGSMVFFWKSLFSWDGALNGLLRFLGAETAAWLDSRLAFPVMLLVFLWKNSGYNMILFLSALGNIPKDYYEAAWMDNASSWQCFLHITVPCIFPAALAALIMSIVNSFRIFREVYLITGNYPHESIYTLQHFMNNMFNSLNFPRLSASAVILVFAVALAVRALLGLERRVA